MASRGRELIYMVRIGNYATRPLRQIEGDFRRLGKASDAATSRLDRLNLQQQRLMQRRANLARQIADPRSGMAIERKRQKLVQDSSRISGQLANNLRSQLAVQRALQQNETRRLAAVLAEEKATARVNKLVKAQASETAIGQARQAQAIAQRRITAAEQARPGITLGLGKLQQEADLLRLKLRQVAVGFGDLDAAKAVDAAATQKLIGEYRLLEGQLAAVTSQIQAENRALEAQRIERAQMGIRAFRDMARVAQYASAAVVVGLGVAAHSAADFQTASAQAATQVGFLGKQVQITDQIMNGIIGQMQRYTANSKDMTNATYQIFSGLSIVGDTARERTANGLKILGVANQISVAGQISLADATDTVIRSLNNFSTATPGTAASMRQLAGFTETMAQAVKIAHADWADFTSSLSAMAPAANAFGQSFEDMAGAWAFLSKRMPPRQAAISYARLTEVFQKAEPKLKQMGVTMRDQTTGAWLPLDKILRQIVKRFPEVAKSRRSLILWLKEISGTMGTAQARRGLTPLLKFFPEYLRLLDKTRNSQGQFRTQLRRMLQQPGVQWDRMINQLRALALTIGRDVLPVFSEFVNHVSKLVRRFQDLDPHLRRNIVKIGLLVGALTLIGSTFGIILSGFAGMALSLTTLGPLLVAAGPELAIIAAALVTIGALWAKYPQQTQGFLGALGRIAGVIGRLGLQELIQYLGLVTAPFRAAARAARMFARWAKALYDKLKDLMGLGPIPIILKISVEFAEAAIKKLKQLKSGLESLPGGKAAAGIIGGILKGVAGAVGATKAYQEVRGGIDFARDIYGAATGGGRRGYPDRTTTRGTRDRARSIMAGEAGPSPQRHKQQIASAAAARETLNRSMQHYVNLLVQAQRYADAHPKSLRANIRLENINTAIQKKFNSAQAAAIQNVAKARMETGKMGGNMQKYVRLLVTAEKSARKHPHSLAAQVRLQQIRNKMEKIFTSDQIAAIEAVVGNYQDADKKRVKSHKDALKQMQQDNQTAIDSMTSAWNSMYEANKSAFGDITQQPLVQNMMDFGVVPRFRDFMGDITSQITKFGDWRKELTQGRKILPKKLMEEVQRAGIEAEPFLAGLLQLTPKQRQAYVKQWERAQKLIKQATNRDFQNRLKDWHGHGRKAALAFLNGMESEQSVINKRMKKIFLQWMKEAGAPVRPHHRPPRRNGKTATAGGVHHHHNNNQIHVHNNKEDLSTTLRKARLAQKRKARRLNI